ncbi:MAG: hypothetical protein ACLPSH_02670 [Vulcanimicrobiaceae bacterium]
MYASRRRHRFAVLTFLATLLAALFTGGVTSPASAQSAPPYGHWATVQKIEELLVFSDGTCAFLDKGKVQVSGRCFWNASYGGGILTITYPMPLEPGKTYFNVVWVNATTIRVWGDVFHKIG